MFLRRLFILALLCAVHCQFGGSPYYTFNDRFVYRDEGQGVASVSGYEPLRFVSSFDCAQSCLSLKKECDCCNSFTYNTFTRECYLKKRAEGASVQTKFKGGGFQSYTFINEPGAEIKFVDKINSIQENLNSVSSSYVHKGFGQLAVQEGDTVLNVNGKKFLTRVSPADCAQACNRVDQCNSFSYNANKNGGICYLKNNMDSSRDTSQSSKGWTTYWKNSAVNNKECFCSCQNNSYCIICVFDSTCFER